MSKTIGIGILSCLLSVSVFSQPKVPSGMPLKTVELYSPWVRKGEKTVGSDPALRERRCFDLVRLEQTCRGSLQLLSYGNRIGVNWDIFAISGGASQTRMIEVGKHDWTDRFGLPDVEPWPKLQPGEKRNMVIDASGADGAHGADGSPGLPGRNADGTYSADPISNDRVQAKKPPRREGLADKPITRQVSSTITMNGKVVRADRYTPLTEVKKGHVYLVRVIDRYNDYYLLFRVDGVVRGTKVTITYLDVKLPAKMPVL